MSARNWQVSEQNGWLHIGFGLPGHINHGPQHFTEFEIQRVLSFGLEKHQEVLYLLDVLSIDKVSVCLNNLDTSLLPKLDSGLLLVADAALLGIESQETEYVGSGMIEDHYEDYTFIVRFDRPEMYFRNTTKTNDWEPSQYGYEIPQDYQPKLLAEFKQYSPKSFVSSFDISDFKAWGQLHNHVRALNLS